MKITYVTCGYNIHFLVCRVRSPGAPVVGLLGCMAERLKEGLFEHGLIDVVAGPDAYRDLPRLLQAVQVGLSRGIEETLSNLPRLCRERERHRERVHEGERG